MTKGNWKPEDKITLTGIELGALNHFFEISMGEDFEQKLIEAQKTLALVEARKALDSIIRNNIESGVIKVEEISNPDDFDSGTYIEGKLAPKD